MSRRLTETAIASRASRRELKEGTYWRGLDPDVHIGYRKGKRGGRWLVRWYAGDQKYSQATLGTADDILTEGTLSYEAAVKSARSEVERCRAKARLGSAGPILTVRVALQEYCKMRDARDSARKGQPCRSDASSRLTLHVLSDEDIAAKDLDTLTEQDLKAWQSRLKPTMKASTRERLANDFKAALNLVFVGNRARLPAEFDKTVKFGLSLDEVPSDADQEDVSESQILADERIRRIIEGAQAMDPDGDFARLVIVLAATGTRFSQAKRMLVSDVQVANSRLLVPESWKGKKKRGRVVRTPVPVGSDVLTALTPAIEGRPANAPLLERWHHEQTAVGQWKRAGRVPWKTASEMTREWTKLVTAIGLPDVIPYALRHSSIVRGIRAGLPVRLVAASHDTSVQMIERHYSRWITDGLEELTARAVIPLVG